MITKRLTANDDVLYVLDNAQAEENANGEVLLRLSGQLDRKLYKRVNKVLETLGGKWNRRAGGHVFSAGRNPISALMALVDEGEIALEDLNFFPTPESVALQMIVLLGLTTDDTVLEPSAGTGAICQQLMRVVRSPLQIHFCELSDERAQLLTDKGYKFMAWDFLPFNGQYSHIIMNPPFSGQRDIAHVTHAFDCLAPGGRLVSVMAEGAFFREDRRSTAFRALLEQYGYSVELPAGAFRASGTGVKTRLVVLEK